MTDIKNTLGAGFDKSLSQYLRKLTDTTFALTTGKQGGILLSWDIESKSAEYSPDFKNASKQSSAGAWIYGVRAEATQLKIDAIRTWLLDKLSDYDFTESLPAIEKVESESTKSVKKALDIDSMF